MLQLHVCSKKLALREWCTLKKVARLEIFFIPSCMWRKCKMFFLELLPFWVQHIHFRKVGRGGGHLSVLEKIYRPCVNFKVLGPPCRCPNTTWHCWYEQWKLIALLFECKGEVEVSANAVCDLARGRWNVDAEQPNSTGRSLEALKIILWPPLA